MGYDNSSELIAQLEKISVNLDKGDRATHARIDQIEKAVNEVLRAAGRPGFSGELDETGERASAIEMCKIRFSERVPKADITKEYSPQSSEIDEALAARRGFRHVIRKGHPNNLDAYVQKSLSAFSFAGTGMMLPPERMSEVFSCIVYPSSLASLVGSVNISGPAAEFLIENPRMGLGAWACEASCFANNPAPELAEGMGLLTIKPETIRFVQCATRDLVEDSSMSFESWLMSKISDGMSATINNSLILGDGVGKPMGMLNPRSGIPICETAAATAAGSITWQDLVSLKWEIPTQWQDGASYLMNQRTWAQVIMMSDAGSRPLFSQLPGGEPGFQFAGSPVNIVTQMPDVMPGSTPVAFGNWKKCYTVVWRKMVTCKSIRSARISAFYTRRRRGLEALEAKLAGVVQDEFAVARLMAVELKAGLVRDQRLEQRLALDERKLRDIPIVKMQKIEGVVHEPRATLAISRRLRLGEARQS